MAWELPAKPEVTEKGRGQSQMTRDKHKHQDQHQVGSRKRQVLSSSHLLRSYLPLGHLVVQTDSRKTDKKIHFWCQNLTKWAQVKTSWKSMCAKIPLQAFTGPKFFLSNWNFLLWKIEALRHLPAYFGSCTTSSTKLASGSDSGLGVATTRTSGLGVRRRLGRCFCGLVAKGFGSSLLLGSSFFSPTEWHRWWERTQIQTLLLLLRF